MSDRTVMELAGSLRAVVAGVDRWTQGHNPKAAQVVSGLTTQQAADLADAASFLEELAQGLASRNMRILQCGGPK